MQRSGHVGCNVLGPNCSADKVTGRTSVCRLVAARLISASTHRTPDHSWAAHPGGSLEGRGPRGRRSREQTGQEGAQAHARSASAAHGCKPFSSSPLLRPFCLALVFPASPALEEPSPSPPRRGFLGDHAPPGTSALWEWLAPLRVLLAPTPLAPTQQNVTSVPVATTVLQG